MGDLLFKHSYRPFERCEYEDYWSDGQRNQTYYGRDETTQAPKYGTSGTTTQEHYSGSTFAKSGGFQDSKYASKAGGFRDSHEPPPMAKDPHPPPPPLPIHPANQPPPPPSPPPPPPPPP